MWGITHNFCYVSSSGMLKEDFNLLTFCYQMIWCNSFVIVSNSIYLYFNNSNITVFFRFHVFNFMNVASCRYFFFFFDKCHECYKFANSMPIHSFKQSFDLSQPLIRLSRKCLMGKLSHLQWLYCLILHKRLRYSIGRYCS